MMRLANDPGFAQFCAASYGWERRTLHYLARTAPARLGRIYDRYYGAHLMSYGEVA